MSNEPTCPESSTHFPRSFTLSHEDAMKVWRDGVSGKILTLLQEIGQAEKMPVPVRVENALTTTETFFYGETPAHIIKKLRGGGAGSTDGDIGACIEGWEYKRYRWWKQVIDRSGQKFTVLPPPVSIAAQDAQIAGAEHLFNPNEIIEKHHLGSNEDAVAKVNLELKIAVAISHALEKHIPQADYKVRYSDDALRLIPISSEAVKSCTEDNETYRAVLGRIREAVPEVKEVIQKFL